jgi:3-hydroxyisobutyrate dehydrogenase
MSSLSNQGEWMVIIGWIGAGKMGKPMCKRLLAEGYSLAVYDVIREKTEELAKLGAKIDFKDPSEIARYSDIIFTSVPGDPELIEVCLGERGILTAARPNSILIDTSTVTPDASAQVSRVAQEKKVRFLRATISGSTELAAKGQLTFFVSGDYTTYEECLPIFNILGKSVIYVGAGEEARYMKLLVNTMVAITAQMVAEALAFGEKAGLNWQNMINVISKSVVCSPLIQYKIETLLKRDFTPAFTVKQMEKDLDYALETAKKINSTLPLTSMVRQFLTMAEATNKGDLDYFSLLLLMEELSGKKET